MDFTQRPATNADMPLLFDLTKRAMKEHVIENFGEWDERYQLRVFEETTDLSRHEILMNGDVPFGFVNLVHRDGEIHINRLCIIPEYQSRGIGTRILNNITAMAGSNTFVKLQVFPKNPAYRLYQRMGFVETKTTSTHIHMMRNPNANPSGTANKYVET